MESMQATAGPWRWRALRLAMVVLSVALLLAMPLRAYAQASIGLSNGEYRARVSLQGGSGRASVASPTRLLVQDGKAMLTVEWSSSHYDYMIVDGTRYLPVNSEGNSTFEIPVPRLNAAFDVTADTTAMSQPHQIDYLLTVTVEEDPAGTNAGVMPMVALAVLVVLALAVFVLRRRIGMRGMSTRQHH